MDWSSTIPKLVVDRVLRTRCHKPRLRRINCQRVEDNTFHLECVYRLADVVERNVVRDVGHANAWRDNEADLSVFKFFVEL